MHAIQNQPVVLHATVPQMDDIAVFGFVTVFVTAVLILYRKQIGPSLILLGSLYAAVAVYGFLSGAWPFGFLLLVLLGSELLGRSKERLASAKPDEILFIAPSRRLINQESRMHRMFGSN